MSPKLQLRTSLLTGPLIEQDALSSLQSTPAGRLSVRVTSRATPGPRFSTTIVNVAVPPALTLPPSGVFVTLTSGHSTVTFAASWSVPSLDVETLAVLLTTPQSAAFVVPETCTVKLAPAARLGFVQARTSLPTAPVIEHESPVVLPVGAPALQSTPAGSGSLTEMPSVVWVPLFVTVTSKPIPAPALTGPAGFAVFSISIVAGATVKHSVVEFVWLAARYCELASGA